MTWGILFGIIFIVWTSLLICWHIRFLATCKKELKKLNHQLADTYSKMEKELITAYLSNLEIVDKIAVRILSDPQLIYYHPQMTKMREHIYKTKVSYNVDSLIDSVYPKE